MFVARQIGVAAAQLAQLPHGLLSRGEVRALVHEYDVVVFIERDFKERPARIDRGVPPAYERRSVEVGILIDDAGRENGPLIIPGSHCGPIHDHHANGVFVDAIEPEASGLDFSRARLARPVFR